jgi:hypothetical protein
MFDRTQSKFHHARRGVGIALLALLAVALLGLVVMSLWNWLLPAIFGLKAVSYWQAVGVLILSRLLLGGFHRHHRPRFHHRQRMLERWGQMTPEAREQFRHGFRGHVCGHREPDKH